MQPKNSVYLYRRLLGYIKPFWALVGLMIIATAIYSATNAVYVAQLKTIIDDGFIQKDLTAIKATIIILVVVTLFRGLGFFTSSYASRRISSDIVLTLRQQMFAHLQCLPATYFDRVNSGETLSRFNYDVLQVTEAATNALMTLVREGVLVIVLLSYLFYQNWKLTFIILALAPVIGLIVKLISQRLRRLAQRIQDNMGVMNHVLDENITGQKIVKLYGGQQHEQRKFHTAVKQVRQAALKTEVATAASTPIIELLIVCAISLIIWLMASQAKMGSLTPGEFLSYTIMMGLLPSPIKKLMRVNEFIQRGLAASGSIFTFLDEATEPQINKTSKFKTPRVLQGEIHFQSVNFSYAETPVLSDFDLHIKPGETVAIVGASGSGKSSLASLIPSFYCINSGKITFDGYDLEQIGLEKLRENIAFVNQETVLFDDTVKHNIAYGVEEQEIDFERVRLAAQAAQAESFILSMEAGYDSKIGESGQRLSGGQKQRLAIARAIYKDAPILVLDEATSALDNESETKVQLALEQLIKARTAIIIAHRLSTIRQADRILVLDKGRIVESGQHDVLLAKKGRYFDLYQGVSIGNNT